MSDYIVRATAADHQIRAFAATTKDIVESGRVKGDGGDRQRGSHDNTCHDGGTWQTSFCGSHDGSYDEGR